jgi:hypothetical protein
MLQPATTVLPDSGPASRANQRGGNPFKDLVQDAVELSRRMELRALRVESPHVRELLRLSAAQQIALAQRLEGYGVKFV